MNLQEIRKFIDEGKLKNLNYSVWDCEENSESSRFLKIGDRIWDGIILEEDVGIELGSKDTPLVKSIMWIEDTNSIHNLQITLIGKDLLDDTSSSHTFGFLILLGGRTISKSEINQIHRTIYLSNNVEGIFEKMSGRKSWYQISKELMKRKLSFYHIGSAIIQIIKQEYPDKIDAIEVIIVVNDDKLLNYFREIHKVSRIESIKHFQEKIMSIQKLRPDCDLENECTVCDNRETCDQIRDMIAKRNKMRRLSK